MTRKKINLVAFSCTLLLSLLITGLTVSHLRGGQSHINDELIQASWDGDVDKINALIRAGANVNFNNAAHPSCIPLTCGAKQGHIKAVQILLDSGADIDATDDSHMTALMWASEGGRADVVQLLILKGADVNATHYGQTALKLAAEKGHAHIVEVLKNAGAKS